jgi:hypothetical protein
MHKSFVLCYKIAAAIILYGVLLAIGSYVFNLGFFAASSSWVVPFIATPSNDKILDMTGKLITSQQSLATLTLDRDRLDTSLGDMKTQKAALLRLDKELQAAISRESVHNEVSGAALAQLDAQKQDDNVKTRAILDDVQQVEDQINQELKAGLITKGDAATQRTAINQAKTSHTDSKIAEVLLRDSVLQKNTTGTQLLDVLSKQADLKSQEVQLDVLIETGEEQLVSDKQQIAFLQQALKIASISPYYLATQGDTQFAFVPYSNQSNMVVGAPVYGCYLSMIICHRVGTVERAFSEEETTMHPVFHTQLRGTLIQLNLTDVQAAKNSVLFLNHKPLLF